MYLSYNTDLAGLPLVSRGRSTKSPLSDETRLRDTRRFAKREIIFTRSAVDKKAPALGGGIVTGLIAGSLRDGGECED